MSWAWSLSICFRETPEEPRAAWVSGQSQVRGKGRDGPSLCQGARRLLLSQLVLETGAQWALGAIRSHCKHVTLPLASHKALKSSEVACSGCTGSLSHISAVCGSDTAMTSHSTEAKPQTSLQLSRCLPAPSCEKALLSLGETNRAGKHGVEPRVPAEGGESPARLPPDHGGRRFDLHCPLKGS